MYVWNGFAIVGKRADLTENLLVTIEKEETALQNETSKWSIKVELIIYKKCWHFSMLLSSDTLQVSVDFDNVLIKSKYGNFECES